MDNLCYDFVKYFTDKYLPLKGLNVCDVGSLDINGSLKDIFKEYKYVGLDIRDGLNVDVVSKDLYDYPFEDDNFDAVVSVNTMEHVADLHRWMKELARIVKRGGYICIGVPNIFPMIHREPIDCWRVYPEGMQFLMKDIAKLEVIECTMSRDRKRRVTFGIGRK